MIEEFDRDGDGEIDEEEFLAIIKPSIVWFFNAIFSCNIFLTILSYLLQIIYS